MLFLHLPLLHLLHLHLIHLLLLPPAAAYGEFCHDVTYSDCQTLHTPQTLPTPLPLAGLAPGECQALCQHTPGCAMFRHSLPARCTLHMDSYRPGCRRVGGPTYSGMFGGEAAFIDCEAALAEEEVTCDQVLEEECTYGTASYRQPAVPTAARCADICSSEQAGMSFLSWQWTGGVEERCDCFTSSSKSCLAIAGPPAPPLDYCTGSSTPGTTGTSAGTTGATPGTTGTTATITSSLPATTSTPSQHMVVITGGNDGSSWNNGAHEEVEVGSLPPKHHRFKFGI